ncbi:hypothetical protein MiTe_03423 [Microcystis aeruginosa NIES-2520]|jgi:hypothetical protein|uniref:Uncharacterized protein n=1 Tax=Microcystis aeruginosa NIES-2520 TaxID=2303982 RepID=A0A5A5RU33_MICAE|nr:hypothetical protein MiTe_03423 [Microcystis aeruginosa NIES-2520]
MESNPYGWYALVKQWMGNGNLPKYCWIVRSIITTASWKSDRECVSVQRGTEECWFQALQRAALALAAQQNRAAKAETLFTPSPPEQ